MKDSVKYFLMGMGRIFDGFSRIFTDPFCIKLNKEFEEKKRGLEERHEVVMNLYKEGGEILNQKPIDWEKYAELYSKLVVAYKEYNDFANKYVRL